MHEELGYWKGTESGWRGGRVNAYTHTEASENSNVNQSCPSVLSNLGSGWPYYGRNRVGMNDTALGGLPLVSAVLRMVSVQSFFACTVSAGLSFNQKEGNSRLAGCWTEEWRWRSGRYVERQQRDGRGTVKMQKLHSEGVESDESARLDRERRLGFSVWSGRRRSKG